MRAIGRMIAAVINEPGSEEVKVKVRGEVAELTSKFPMYKNRLKPRSGEASVG
jgi:glycine/serine hydroxymethyltransferase